MSTENEILAEVEHLKARFSDTKALYREVCALLFFRYGITPTTNKLYQYVRKGTMSTPAEALAKFWDELRSKARVEIDHPDLPPEIKAVAAEAIAAIWQQSGAAARAELAAIRLELQAEREQLRHDSAQAEQALGQAHASIERLQAELAATREGADIARAELESERRAHAGAMARLQEQQNQLEQARAQQQRLQEGFSADLAKAREAVEAAEQRAAATMRRALLEIEHDRQARAKAEKLVETLHRQCSEFEARERQAAVAHAEALTRLQGQCAVSQAAHDALQAQIVGLEGERTVLRQRLLDSQQEAAAQRAEAQTLQTVLERLTKKVVATPRPAKKKAPSTV